MKTGTPAAMLARMKAISMAEIAGNIMEDNLDKLKALNLKQMMQGRNNKGELFTPTHTNNPFFKSPESAMAYARWKQRIWPETPFNVANFKITGYYHESISFSRRADMISAESSASFADKIQSEFKDTTLGLNPDSKQEAWNDIIRSPMLHEMAGKIGCEVT